VSADETVARFHAAGEAGDVDALLTTIADDVVVHSPLTDRADFRGRAQVRALFEVVYTALGDLTYHTEVGDERTRALFGTGTAGRQRIDASLLLRLDDHAKITEITLYIRPLPGLTAVMAALGPPLARRYGRSRGVAALVSAMVRPLVAATKFGDRVGIPLALPKSGAPH
jgi:SnoaL-like protein